RGLRYRLSALHRCEQLGALALLLVLLHPRRVDELSPTRHVGFAQRLPSKRYVAADETGRPMEMWSWPSSGNATQVWAINPSAWGFDTNRVGPGVFQPVLHAGQYQDIETVALLSDGATVHRPGLAQDGLRTYDPFSGNYLQPVVDRQAISAVRNNFPIVEMAADDLIKSNNMSRGLPFGELCAVASYGFPSKCNVEGPVGGIDDQQFVTYLISNGSFWSRGMGIVSDPDGYDCSNCKSACALVAIYLCILTGDTDKEGNLKDSRQCLLDQYLTCSAKCHMCKFI
ncbi:MAG: hypothetical protein SFX73_04270, partial [Kofleriaceae bacterium]|nr:hypothetical protein [Kofleriaceae bacterium]